MADTGERRPRQEAALESAATTTTHSLAALDAPGADLIARRRRWAYALIKRSSSPPPTYGSVEWLALVEGSAEKVAGVVVAAECWAQAGDDLEPDLRRLVEQSRHEHRAREDENYAARAHAHRERYGHLRPVPPLPDQRSRIAEARQPRPGDYPGGPVAWRWPNGAGQPAEMCDGCGELVALSDRDHGCRAGNPGRDAS